MGVVGVVVGIIFGVSIGTLDGVSVVVVVVGVSLAVEHGLLLIEEIEKRKMRFSFPFKDDL